MGSKKGAFVTVVSVIVALIVAMATIQSTQASIDYWLKQPNSYSPGLNQVTLCCKNGGGMDGDFNILLKFENASFSKQTQMPYSYVDDTTVKIKYVLHKGDSVEKTIFFNASQIQGFSITISLEKTNFIEFIKANALFPTQVSYLWDPVLQSFNCTTAE